ncbi:hypothetical protein IWW52_003594, partial [Coemansia sp. RSA 2704]
QQDPSTLDADIARLVSELVGQLGDRSADIPEIWAKYDQLKIRRVLLYIPYESWLALLKTCQRTPTSKQPTLPPAHVKGMFSSHQDGRSSAAPGGLDAGRQSTWTRGLSKRRALMFLGDMWRYSGMTRPSKRRSDFSDPFLDSRLPGSGVAADSVHSVWRPAARHYNIALDAIGRDCTSAIDELILLHRDMRSHSIREDTITFNTLLNGCRRLRAWGFFREVEAQMRQRDEWGITRMDVTSWATLVQGYRECKDWEAADRCVAEVSSACRTWYRLQTDGKVADSGIKPTVELWSTIVNVYAARDMVPEMLASRRVMQGFGLSMSAHTFAPIFAALHRARRSLARQKKDAWPAIELALDEYEAMRASNVSPNATILTNLALTVGLSNTFAQPDHAQGGRDDRVLARLSAVNSTVARELESMLTRAHDPHTYAALLNLSSKSGSLDDIRAVWASLISEVRFARITPTQPLLTSLTLSAYMNALIACRRYEEAISAFYVHVTPDTAIKGSFKRPDIAAPKLLSADHSVYNAALQAFARADRHRACVHVLRQMVGSGIQPSALAIRYSLLPPDYDAQKSRSLRYTRRWSLPLATARDIWQVVINSRQREWARGARGPPTHAPDDRLPVIVNDIAAQLIRIAAYARNVEFGEEVFDALNREAAYFGMAPQHAGSDSADADGHGTPVSASNTFPEDLQCAPNVRTYTSMITLYCNNADLPGVSKMWAQMINDGIEPTLHTYTSLITALHKIALRKRWKKSREQARMPTRPTAVWEHSDEVELPADDGLRFGGSGMGDRIDQIWSPTSHDTTIKRVEDRVVNAAFQTGNTRQGAQQTQNGDDSQLNLDIPLSTLLLWYHSSRIRDTVDSVGRSQANRSSLIDEGTAEDIERVMRVCQAVEEKGLTPDYRFHVALANFLETCGDGKSAELVRRHMDDAP